MPHRGCWRYSSAQRSPGEHKEDRDNLAPPATRPEGSHVNHTSGTEVFQDRLIAAEPSDINIAPFSRHHQT